jgi:hypothetical protein
VAGDLLDPASLAPALRSVEIASLATAASPRLGELEGNFIQAVSFNEWAERHRDAHSA